MAKLTTAQMMQRKRKADAKIGLKRITTPLPEHIIVLVDTERAKRRLLTRGDAIAAIAQEWASDRKIILEESAVE